MQNRVVRSLLAGGACLFGCAACTDVYAEQIDACERSMQAQPAVTVLIGAEGVTSVCGCVVDSLAVRFPDAADRWSLYASELDQQISQRGLLGLAADTSWTAGRGREYAEFVAAHGEVLGQCGRQLIPYWPK